MKKRLAIALLAALLGSGSSFALAADGEPKACAADKAHCDLDGDGIVNPDDDDVDGDGTTDEADPCPRDPSDTCDDGEDPGGEDPGIPGLPTLPELPPPGAPELPAPAVPELPAPPA